MVYTPVFPSVGQVHLTPTGLSRNIELCSSLLILTWPRLSTPDVSRRVCFPKTSHYNAIRNYYIPELSSSEGCASVTRSCLPCFSAHYMYRFILRSQEPFEKSTIINPKQSSAHFQLEGVVLEWGWFDGNKHVSALL